MARSSPLCGYHSMPIEYLEPRDDLSSRRGDALGLSGVQTTYVP